MAPKRRIKGIQHIQFRKLLSYSLGFQTNSNFAEKAILRQMMEAKTKQIRFKVYSIH